jgi:hypothetical protein
MWVYHRNPYWAWEDAVAEAGASVMLVILVMVAAVVATVIVILLMEIARIYQAQAFAATTIARILWIALAALLAVWLLAGLLAASPATLPLGLYLAAWAFLAFVVIAEGCDLYAQRHS